MLLEILVSKYLSARRDILVNLLFCNLLFKGAYNGDKDTLLIYDVVISTYKIKKNINVFGIYYIIL